MKNEVDKNLLNNALKGFVKRLEKTEKFVLDQAPDICKQMILEAVLMQKFSLYSSIAGIIVGIICFFYALPYDWTYDTRYTSDIPNRYGFLVSIGFILFVIGIILGSTNIYKLIYLKKCPKLFLLREFKKLVDS